MYGDNFKAGCELSKFIEAPVSRACCTGQDTDLRESIARSCTNLIQIKAWRDTKKEKKLWTTLRTAVRYGKQSHQTLHW